MNLWVARGPAAIAEAGVMSPIANWFISTKTSGPVNGQVQDSTIGCAELTRSVVRLDKYHAMALFAGTGTEPPRFDGRPAAELYTGREVVSLLLAGAPVNYSRAPTSYSDVYAPYIGFDPSETLTVIEEGVLKRGVLDKKAIGAKAGGGVYHLIAREYGPQRALDMIFAMQQMALQFLVYRGFTVGKADLMPSPEAAEQIRAVFSSVLLESRTITDRLLRGEIVPPIDSTVHEFYEDLQMAALKPPESELLRWILGSTATDTNGFFRMIAVGAKGSNPNLLHVEAGIGSTTINGRRIGTQFAFGRTLPYFPRFATEAEAHGFVVDSYMSGMGVTQFTFQNMNGRFDLINKALSTSVTGHFMRKGIMNNQSSVVDNHRRVVKDTRVVQFLYGEDGLDSRELEAVRFRGVALSDAELEAAAGVADLGPDPTGAGRAAVEAALAAIRADRDAYRAAFGRIEAVNFGQTFPETMLMPVNVQRTVEGVLIAAKNAGVAPPPPDAAGLAARLARVADLCARLPYTLVNEIQERRGTPVPPHKRAASMLMVMLARFELSPAVVARLNDEQLTYVIDAVRSRYASSLVDYGTAVGVLAAQSISEPLTQYMLDSHHRSVAGGTSKSGLVRISEIYACRAVADEQSPAMQLPLRAAALGADPDAAAQEIANSIEHVTLRRFTARCDTLLEPHGALVYPPYAADAAWMAEFARAHPLVRPPGDLSNWCFRFVLDKSALVLKAVDLELIVGRLRRLHPGVYVAHTQEAVPEVVVRCWLRASQFKKGAANDEDRAADVLAGLLDTPVRGIAGVVTAKAEKVARRVAGPGGAFAKVDRHVISTSGTNLYGALLHSAVDPTCAISTSVGDTYKLYGIEAARAKIISETRAFMEDSVPNLRHLQLYCDEMTRTGRVTSVERGGLGAREPGNVLLRMAYGSPIGVVTDAALSCAKSRVYGVAAAQLLGSVPQIGTLYNGLVMDDEFIQANTRSVDSVLDEL
jgi:DNA-directed RNA polymerase II subunit RPB1